MSKPEQIKNWDVLQKTRNTYESTVIYSGQIPRPKLENLDLEMDDSQVKEHLKDILHKAEEHTLRELDHHGLLKHVDSSNMRVTAQIQGNMISINVQGPVDKAHAFQVKSAIKESLDIFLKSQEEQKVSEEKSDFSDKKENHEFLKRHYKNQNAMIKKDVQDVTQPMSPLQQDPQQPTQQNTSRTPFSLIPKKPTDIR